MPRRKHRKTGAEQAKRAAERARVTQFQNPNMVLSKREWCALVGISHMTGQRLFAAGKGPPVIQLSDCRFGIRMSDHVRWLEARTQS